MKKIVRYRVIEYFGNHPKESISDVSHSFFRVEVKRGWWWTLVRYCSMNGMAGSMFDIKEFDSYLEVRQYLFDELVSIYNKSQIQLIEYPGRKIGLYRDDKTPIEVYSIQDLKNKI